MKSLVVYIYGEGSVQPMGGSYQDNTVVPLLAVPAAGWTFFKWAGTDGDTANPTTVHMNDNKEVAAYFARAFNFDPKPLLIGVSIIAVIALLAYAKQRQAAPKLAYARVGV